jgi:hypothetical protein
MTTMIEMIARAMGMVVYERDGPEKAKHIVDRCWQDWIPEARAALTAMLDPSDAMAEAGEHGPTTNSPEGDFVSADDARGIFRAMVQTALDEKDG